MPGFPFSASSVHRAPSPHPWVSSLTAELCSSTHSDTLEPVGEAGQPQECVPPTRGPCLHLHCRDDSADMVCTQCGHRPWTWNQADPRQTPETSAPETHLNKGRASGQRAMMCLGKRQWFPCVASVDGHLRSASVQWKISEIIVSN
jgi:hypothetical protein